MALDDRTLAVYRVLDAATLLALLPALRYEAERTKEEAETFERVRQAVPEHRMGDVPADAAVRERRMSEAGLPQELALARSAHDRSAPEDELAKVLDRLDRYHADLLERERWIRNDLVRRGLLPDYPFWGER
jgi:hypothetical protein